MGCLTAFEFGLISTGNHASRTGVVHDGILYLARSDSNTGFLDIFNTLTGSWQKVGIALYSHINPVYGEGKIFLPRSSSTAIELYDIALGQFSTKMGLTSAFRPGNCYGEGKFFSVRASGDVLDIYDIATDTLSQKSLPTSYTRWFAVYAEGKVYISRLSSSIVDVYTIATGALSTISLATSYGIAALFASSERKLIVDYTTKLIVYDLETGAVTTKDKTYTNKACLAYGNGKVYAREVCELNDNTHVESRYMDIYDIATDTIEATILYPPMPAVSSINLVDGKVYEQYSDHALMGIYDLADGGSGGIARGRLINNA